MKKVLITGSNGLLGQKLVGFYLDKEVEFLATSRGRNRVSTLPQENYKDLDITDRSAVIRVMSDFNPDVVINTAAMTNVDACESDREAAVALNVKAVEYLTEGCKMTGAHFIHLSTDFIFDGESGPYTEDDEPNPLSFYGKTKLDAEELVKNSGLEKWAIARTIIVYGICEEMSRSNIVLWAKSALEQGNELTIVDDQFRSPTFAEDLALGCIAIEENGAHGVYNLSGKDLMSILELVQRVGAEYGLSTDSLKPIKSATLNQAAKRPPKTGFILDKAKKDLGYNPRSFEEGLRILKDQLSSH